MKTSQKSYEIQRQKGKVKQTKFPLNFKTKIFYKISS